MPLTSLTDVEPSSRVGGTQGILESSDLPMRQKPVLPRRRCLRRDMPELPIYILVLFGGPGNKLSVLHVPPLPSG